MMPTSAVNARVASADAARRTRCRSSPPCKRPTMASPWWPALRKCHLPGRRSNSSLPIAKSLVRPLTVVSDGLHCFMALEGAGVHERVITGSGKASVKLPQFQAVNTVLSNLKTAMAGTYHAVKIAKYAHRYLAEVQYRFNRRFDLKSILPRLVRVAAVTEPHNRVFIREAELGC